MRQGPGPPGVHCLEGPADTYGAIYSMPGEEHTGNGTVARACLILPGVRVT